MRRVLVDLKAVGGTPGLPGAGRPTPTWWWRASGRAWSTGWASAIEAVRAVNPTVIYCSTSGYGQTGPRAAWAGHDLDYLGIGGFLATSGPRGDGGPPIPGATVADAAAGGMHAALAVTAALAGRQTTGRGAYLDVSVADGVLWLMSLAVDEHLATGARPGPGHDILTGRYACYDTYRTADGRWLAVGAIEHKFFANLCRALGLRALGRPPARRRGAGRDPRRLPGRLRHPRPGRLGGRAGRWPTPVWRRCWPWPRWPTTSSSPTGGRWWRPCTRPAVLPPGGPGARRHGPSRPGRSTCPTRRPPTPTLLLKAAGVDARDRGRLAGRGSDRVRSTGGR